MGIRTIAVFSEPDRGAPHVLHADEAYPIGSARASESYLNIRRLLDVARRADARAVHPGYGFLAERSDFAEAVAAAGLVFVGPAARTDPREWATRPQHASGWWRRACRSCPGPPPALTTASEARRAARAVGLPVVLKAAAGGGGKGMRVVRRVEDVAGAYEGAIREAEAAFGDGSVYVERFLGPSASHRGAALW